MLDEADLSQFYVCCSTCVMTCLCEEKESAKIISRFLSDLLNSIEIPLIFKDVGKAWDRYVRCVAISTASVFSWFIWSLLHIIQNLTSHMHFSMFWLVTLISDGLLELYNLVSSLYNWCDTGWLLITYERGWVYRMKRIGPKTEPWRTPQWMVAGRIVSHL